MLMYLYATDVPDYVCDPDWTDLTTVPETYVLLDIYIRVRQDAMSLRIYSDPSPEGLKYLIQQYTPEHRDTIDRDYRK